MTADSYRRCYSGPDWAARAASEARDEQRRNPRWYPLTKRERLELDYTPDQAPGNEDAPEE